MQKLTYPKTRAGDVQNSHHFHPLSLSLALVATLLVTGCNEAVKPSDSATDPAASSQSSKAALGNWGVAAQFIDPSIKPGDDFYRYVNKGWLDTAKIPQGKAVVTSFTEVQEKTDEQVADIIKDSVSANAAKGTPAQRIAGMYKSFMNTERSNQLGLAVIKPELDSILAMKKRSQFINLMANPWYNLLFVHAVLPDSGNPDRYIALIAQGGLNLPDREFYLQNKEPYIGHRHAYLDYIAGVFKRAGMGNATKRAKTVLDFETKLAKNHWTAAEVRDAVKTYHVMQPDELARYAPGFDWQVYLKAVGFDKTQKLQVSTDSAIKLSVALFARTPIDTLRDYAAFSFLQGHASLLSADWVDADFDMYSRRLHGIEKSLPIEKLAVDNVNLTLGEDIGKIYVERHFTQEIKAKTQEMADFIIAAMKEHLAKLEWMDDATRKQALTKLANLPVEIGYPTQWHDFSSMQLNDEDIVRNVHEWMRWNQKDQLAMLDEPVRRWEWGYPPQVINAFYNRQMNKMVFLAGIIKPPFFDPNADPAVNFGAIGMVVGHEIGHGFDDQGSQFDSTGKLRNWWSTESRNHFKAKTDKLVARYNGFTALPGLNVNGQLTLGENIGDMCGLSVAYSAFQKYAAAHYPNGTPPVLDGFTGNQRFFLGYAQMWRMKVTDGKMRELVLTNSHSPGEFRTNGIAQNFDPWYEAFGVTEANKMYLPEAERIKIW